MGCGAPKQKAGEVADPVAAIEAIVPLAGVARQVLLADAVEGAVEPGLKVAEQDMDDGQHGIDVLAAVLGRSNNGESRRRARRSS